MSLTGREIGSTIDEVGTITIAVRDVSVADPGDDEIVVRVEATPINPSDLFLLLGPADVATLTPGGNAEYPTLSGKIPPARLAGVGGRLGITMPVGNEGAGVVVAAGSNVATLMGKRVGMVGGAMFADYRKIAAKDVVVLPDGVTAANGASMFVNPLTALGFVETMKRDGHHAIVHTAAASNLGQMLLKVCLKDGIPLVNIVRSQEQVDLLRGLGATHVLNSKAEGFLDELAQALRETGATIAFDAIGGGDLGDEVLQAMERVAVESMTEYNRYGSETFKQLYIYGALDLAATTLNRPALGFLWSVSGWLLFPFLRKAGPEVATRLRQRIVDELQTTFASHYTRVIGLAEALRPDVVSAYVRKATGEKFLIDPVKG